MLLKKLKFMGFKSFADRISMRFDKGITAIVESNGCGKAILLTLYDGFLVNRVLNLYVEVRWRILSFQVPK